MILDAETGPGLTGCVFRAGRRVGRRACAKAVSSFFGFKGGVFMLGTMRLGPTFVRRTYGRSPASAVRRRGRQGEEMAEQPEPEPLKSPQVAEAARGGRRFGHGASEDAKMGVEKGCSSELTELL